MKNDEDEDFSFKAMMGHITVFLFLVIPTIIYRYIRYTLFPDKCKMCGSVMNTRIQTWVQNVPKPCPEAMKLADIPVDFLVCENKDCQNTVCLDVDYD
jgi:hypothetical protein